MPDATGTTFGERLIEALEFQGITDPAQRVEKVAQACQITPATARKYLQATKLPNFLVLNLSRFEALASALDADRTWLFCGRDATREEQVINNMRAMSEWERSKFVRYVMRLRNNDPNPIPNALTSKTRKPSWQRNTASRRATMM